MDASGLNDEQTRSLRRVSSSTAGAKQPLGFYNGTVIGDISPVYGRTISSSLLEVGGTASVMSLMEQEQFRSKSVAWKEPLLLLQRIRSRRVPGVSQVKPSRSYRQQSKGSTQQIAQDFHRPSRWIRFWRKLRLDGGKKVHAARPEWLNYDSQSYAMNFEKDWETAYQSNSQQMPKISGPGAREIVTVLLRRSSSANRNSGSILIPKPVFLAGKQGTNAPLWKRRSVQAPSSLIIKMAAPSIKRRANAAA